MASAHHISFLEDFEVTSANFREILLWNNWNTIHAYSR